MPVVHKSTIRRARQSEKRRLRNRSTISSVRSILRKVQDAITAKKPDEAKATLREATSALSKAVTKGVLKPNTASRRVSRLTVRVNAITASA
ncbi:MAG: 30S ribosomal protein S20 [Nitrospira sp.]|jgi:small subunit ribosomal protein S20|uniref:30S ribosomal protein S20 n=1 Tax=Nitrospira sp. ND1 TaxID=1658518 RepID=UPI0009BBBCFD|nr:30S ribosomal protein S20 [Nitrospira sp. ND1]MBK7418202.1 30S ribosomal protein S20 [Nitrospira sp.]OYT22571.1 MAG: 30S ribosomal protein S20 [Nitrospira sp. UW-LDO-02]MBK7484741.1 30S ribosomal protein S20 [Nitrospira sp.]MBK8376817.1 30S ribosomal protein S20 [Nitrospira sp.]MBK9112596.1 30S ribosomal protein S20 [Nitrospira sp.]